MGRGRAQEGHYQISKSRPGGSESPVLDVEFHCDRTYSGQAGEWVISLTRAEVMLDSYCESMSLQRLRENPPWTGKGYVAVSSTIVLKARSGAYVS